MSGTTGSKLCPTGYHTIKSAETCEKASDYLGLVRRADKDVDDPSTVCFYCGGCGNGGWTEMVIAGGTKSKLICEQSLGKNIIPIIQQ